MKLYGKKFAKKFIDKRVSGKAETRDAILWDVQTDTKTCRVKIQGSDKLIIAHYPRNWKKIPYWLKRGNAVRILHRTGTRGYVEVIGEGRAIPTPVSGQMMPDQQTLPDGFITGGDLYETTPPSMNINATGGTYRISGNVYFYTPPSGDYIVMNDPAPMVMGDGILMGTKIGGLTLDAAPAAGYFRYDAFVVGTDGTTDYVKGTESKTPEKPTIPGSHVLIDDYILVRGGVTTITDNDIGAEWTAQKASSLDLDIEDSGISYELEYNSLGSGYVYADISIDVLDQYGNLLPSTYNGYLIELEKKSGAGDLYSAESGWSSSSVQQHCTTGYTFQYRLLQNPGPGEDEKVVTLLATLSAGANELQATGIIILIDNPV